MKQKCISLSEDIIDKLKDETNASGLIEKLLRDWYFLTPEQIISEVKDKMSEKEKIKLWGMQVRAAHAKEGRTTDLDISAWMTGATFQLQDKWRQFLELERVD